MASANVEPEENNSLINKRYEKLRELGRGAFGKVYLAFDTKEKDRYWFIQTIIFDSKIQFLD